MAENDKVKVVGYAQRVFYDNGIEYRNFSDDLVGFQLASDNGTPIFTSGNFVITTSIDTKPSKLFVTKSFSSFMTLNDLQLDYSTAQSLLVNNTTVRLNLDKSNLCNYAFFGSLREFIRVSLEDIIINWPASIKVLHSNPVEYNSTGYTIENCVYDPIVGTSTFKVPTNNIVNKFNINYLQNGTILNTYNETNDLRNLTVNYSDYVVSLSSGDYPVTEFTASTNQGNDYLYFKVKGQILTGSTSIEDLHVRPNNQKVELFFNSLPDFESNLLNRLTLPKYTSSYEYTYLSDIGAILRTEKTLTWPVTDGYNIDFDTTSYANFVEELLELAEGNDRTKTDLMVRQLTSESISDFDTLPTCDGEEQETAGQKMNKTLKIYGREFDEVKRYIDGIAFSDVVTYNKKDNTPDIYLKNLGRVLGWDLVSSILENDLLSSFLTPADPTYSGHSRGLTPMEAEIEMWRRIIMNTPWIWKSKGTRKSVEFLLKFIGTPNGLIEFNEYIYKAKGPADIVLLKDLMLELYGDSSIEDLLVDSEGYPRVAADTPEMYFQKAGLWYRETGGPNSMIDILDGNNPHVGPYDGGQEYIDQFTCLIPDFSAATVVRETTNTETTNLFTNYNYGIVDDATESEVWASIVNSDNIPLSACYELIAEIIDDPKPTNEVTDCGCEAQTNDEAIRISIKKLDGAVVVSPTPTSCGYSAFTLNQDGYVVFQTNLGDTTQMNLECCEALGFTYAPSGDISCWWSDNTTIDTKLCRGWEPDGSLESGLVTWVNNDLQIGNTTVGSAKCCEAYGYLAVQVDTGTFECYTNHVFKCSDFTPYQISKSGVVTFQDKNGELTTSISPACCSFYGYEVVSGKGGYQCVQPRIVKPLVSSPIKDIRTKL